MHEITGDLFESELADAICITTNGFVNAQGSNTMGRGCAGEAKRRWPGIQMVVGGSIRHGGNDCRLLTQEVAGRLILPIRSPWEVTPVPYHIFMFPTKPEGCSFEELLPAYKGRTRALTAGEVSPTTSRFPGWMGKSDLSLIERSARQLVELTETHGFKSVVLPRPGCGEGERSWEGEVRPLLTRILDERFWVITFPPKE